MSMRNETYSVWKEFYEKFRGGIKWRVAKHCSVADRHLNPNEEVQFVVAGQLDNDRFSFFNTGVIVITNERLIVAQKYILPGYKFISITPDMYNDLSVFSGFFWGGIIIDTIKEQVYMSNLSKSGLPEIETQITAFMQESKKAYAKSSREEN